MKISKIDFSYFSWPRTRKIRNGVHVWGDIVRCVVRIETDDGIVGHGIGSATEGERQLREFFASKLIGMNPLLNERIWGMLWDSKIYGRRGRETSALSTLDLALWDIRSKVANMPLYQLLGGYTDRIAAYVAGGYYVEGEGIPDLQREMVSYVELGTRAVKMKIGGASQHEDVARVKAVREAIGPEISLMLDANASYKYHEAISIAKRLEAYDITWLEEPVHPDDYDGFRKIAAQTAIPLAAGEQEYTKFGFRDLIATGAIAYVQPDARWMGGVTEFTKVAALAQANGITISAHGDQQVNLHLMCAIPNGNWIEYYPATFDPVLPYFYREGAKLDEQGMLRASDQIGSGCTPDESALAKYRVSL